MLVLSYIIVAVLFLFIGVSIGENKKSVAKFSDELNDLIEIAIVDGILTPKEKKLIAAIAGKYNVAENELFAEIENRIKKQIDIPETELVDVNKRKGDDFEKFIVGILRRNNYLKLKEWTGDKYVDGIYSKTNQNPDLIVETSLKGKYSTFAIECKWRKGFYNNMVQIADESQMKRYKKYESSNNITVYIALGMGGTAAAPDELFIIPINEIHDIKIGKNDLIKYRKDLRENEYFFFYDSDSGKFS